MEPPPAPKIKARTALRGRLGLCKAKTRNANAMQGRVSI